MSRHLRLGCPKTVSKSNNTNGEEDNEEDGAEDVEKEIENKKKTVGEKVQGICPFCEYKLMDLLGHIR